MTPWLRALAELDRAREPAVLITVVTARGSTPREAGCKMVVTAEHVFDTIGGGALELTCITEARAMLPQSSPLLRDFPLGPALGQCCGGYVTVLFEPITTVEKNIAIFGAGHVGRALADVLSGLPISVTLIDTRPEALASPPEDARICLTRDPAGEIARLPASTIVLIMTHDHQIDFDITSAALTRSDLGGVGLIGSETKRIRFIRRLARTGLGADAIARLICPIGLPGAGGKRPKEIAISVAAWLLQAPKQSAPVTDCHSTCGRCEVAA